MINAEQHKWAHNGAPGPTICIAQASALTTITTTTTTQTCYNKATTMTYRLPVMSMMKMQAVADESGTNLNRQIRRNKQQGAS